MIDIEATIKNQFGSTEISAVKAVIWFYEEFYKPLEVQYEERGASMRETGDMVRSLYVGSEVSKRILGLRAQISLEREISAMLKEALELINHPNMRDDGPAYGAKSFAARALAREQEMRK